MVTLERAVKSNVALPGMSSTRETYLFLVTNQQTNTLVVARLNEKTIFYKTDNGYLNSLRSK